MSFFKHAHYRLFDQRPLSRLSAPARAEELESQHYRRLKPTGELVLRCFANTGPWKLEAPVSHLATFQQENGDRSSTKQSWFSSNLTAFASRCGGLSDLRHRRGCVCDSSCSDVRGFFFFRHERTAGSIFPCSGSARALVILTSKPPESLTE